MPPPRLYRALLPAFRLFRVTVLGLVVGTSLGAIYSLISTGVIMQVCGIQTPLDPMTFHAIALHGATLFAAVCCAVSWSFFGYRKLAVNAALGFGSFSFLYGLYRVRSLATHHGTGPAYINVALGMLISVALCRLGIWFGTTNWIFGRRREPGTPG